LLPALSVARRIVGPAAATTAAVPAFFRNERREEEADCFRVGEVDMAGSLKKSKVGASATQLMIVRPRGHPQFSRAAPAQHRAKWNAIFS
jgi:hypothetical protein